MPNFFSRPVNAKIGLNLWATLLFLGSVVLALLVFCVLTVVPQQVHGIGILLLQGELGQILSPTSGTLERWLKEEGDTIKIGDTVALVRPHSNVLQTQAVKSGVDGVIAEIITYANTQATLGQALAIVTSLGDTRKDLELIGFVSSLEGKKIFPGMTATITPSVTNDVTHGHVLATVKRVGKLPMTKTAVQSMVKIPEVAKYIRKQVDGEPFVVVLSLIHNSEHKTGYQWSGPGPSFELDSGTFADISITYAEPSILSLLWPGFERLRSEANL